MALPALHLNVAPADLGSPAPGQRDLPGADTAKRRAQDDSRRLRRVKDSREQLKSRTRARAASNGTIDTAASSSTAAGRSYTVANFNHGVIYLRPIVRAGNHRQPTPTPFVFPPQTPPDSAHRDKLRPLSNEREHSLYGTATPRSEPTPPLPTARAGHASQHPPDPAVHARSHSFSTLDEHTVTTTPSIEPGTFKVVIERPPFGRPKTADTSSCPLLQVPIPHYRLGTPRFSTLGTPDLRSSVYTRASAADDASTSLLPSRPRSDAFSPLPLRYRATMARPPLPASAPSSARVSEAPIGPRLYDALTVNPDAHAVVRFSPTGDILAATPSRLVAHITSPSFLDYELLSDFFLTFRAFLCTKDLVAYLISRLRWAVDRQDDFGRIVRVRTFVALRHWILNYFVDDFVPFYKLRTYFCHLVNDLYRDLQARHDGGGGDVKIVGELKKCWRRTCAIYWETDDGFGQNFANDELLPGGQVDSQGTIEELDQRAQTPSTPKRQTVRDTKETMGSNPSDQFASRHMEWAQRARHTPQNSMSSPYVPSQEYDMHQAPLSPASEQSMHVLSCSIPMPGMSKPEQIDLPLYPHPVPAGASPARRVASPQQPVSAKRNRRPSHSHKRSGSFSDALRDSRVPLASPKISPETMSLMANMPGSLVRGGLVQPSSPYFEIKSLRHTRSQMLAETEEFDDQQRSGHSSSPGMKKILGTVRRALSTRQPMTASPQLGGSAHQRQAPATRSSNPGATSTPLGGEQKRRAPRSKPQVRVDVLAVTVAESFRDAVNAQLESESLQQQGIEPPELGGFEFEFDSRGTPAVDGRRKSSYQVDPRVQSNITTGSKSILIYDDTGAPPMPMPMMTGALPVDDQEAEVPFSHQPDDSMDQRLVDGDISQATPDEVHEQPTQPIEEQPLAQPVPQRPLPRPRRSISEGPEQMHSFRRRGSTKTSIARSSLRRHASYNSGLGRHRAADSVATFQTMSSNNDPFIFDRQLTTETSEPARQLRRRPGGDLRAAGNVHDLEPLQRPHSTGSVSNMTHSVANSVILRSDRYVDPSAPVTPRPEEVEEAPKRAISLVDTHSSQPNLRPSFEVEVAKLAALPDDTDDEGGVESALMKLEGRYEKKSPSIPSRPVTMDIPVYRPTGAPTSTSQPIPSEHEDDDEDVRPEETHQHLASSEAGDQGTYQSSIENFTHRVPAVNSVGESTDSYSSIPLLDRDLSDTAMPPRTHTLETMRSSAKPSPLQFTGTTTQGPPTTSSLNSSIEYVVETDSIKRLRDEGARPTSSLARQSFLLDEDEDLSDMSSTPTDGRSDQTSHGVRSFFDDEPTIADHENCTHPMRHPSTPPVPVNRLNSPLPNATIFDDRGLPTPGLTPTTSRLGHQAFAQSADSPVGPHGFRPETSKTAPAHLPFVLAYDSEVLAQQFTIVEKDALDEIDWKELIELRWKQSSPQIRDWVQYLRAEEARGVDVVIARFNLVVKWVVSECVLTENVEERARCLVKYIHIAQHARRLRNYATMYQLAIALISNDLSRLKHTWALVPAAELEIMKELEALVQPLRNFHNLRLEMETTTVEDGCIPFIGIYTRDLIYNAQKPAFIDAPPAAGEKLVNFDRHHTAATIVKNLLRLLEASSKYTFKVDPLIISRCLWLAALTDDEISKRSRLCE